jgi:hypothetical protein
MLHLHECAEPTPTESAADPLHSVGDATVVEESAVEPLHSTDDPTVVESLQCIADLYATVDAPTETSYS